MRSTSTGRSVGSGCLALDIFYYWLGFSACAIRITQSQLRCCVVQMNMIVEWRMSMVLEKSYQGRRVPLLGLLSQWVVAFCMRYLTPTRRDENPKTLLGCTNCAWMSKDGWDVTLRFFCARSGILTVEGYLECELQLFDFSKGTMDELRFWRRSCSLVDVVVIETYTAAYRQCLIVPDFIDIHSIVLSWAKCKSQHTTAKFLSSWSILGSVGWTSISLCQFIQCDL